VVGDKNQSIYSFQGANIELYSDFAHFYKSYERIHLKYNYRSTPQIVETGNNFLEAMLNEQEDVVKYITCNPDSTPVHVREFSSINLEIEYIFNLIVSNINKKIKRNDAKTKIVNFSDFAILTRTNEARLLLKKMLVRNGIPCKSKGLTALEYKEEKITRSLQHFLDTTNLNKNNTISELVKKIKEQSGELEDDRQNEEFTNLQLDFENNDKDKISEPKSHEKHMVQILLSLSAEYLDYAGDRKILEFLDYIKNPKIKYKRNNRDWHSINNAVEIKTTHSAKGEEFPFVIIANSVERHYPINFIERELKVPNELKQYQPSHDKYDDENSHFAEESRIYYVAMTRAKNELFLTYSLKDGNSEELKSSRFLKFLEFTGSQQNLEKKIIPENGLLLRNGAEQIFYVTDEISSEPDREIVDNSTGKYFFNEFMTPRKILRICSPWISKAFAEKFADLSKKNIEIQIITHYEDKNLSNFETVQFLEKNKSHNLQFVATKELVHLKMFIKDETLAINGSANFTISGLWNQKNRITIFRESNTVKKEIEIFDNLWNDKNRSKFTSNTKSPV
jgi:superfamily I DNA/RNA helicase